ncbi:hypothetical protein LshimejAT787_0506960 [Lyophyllum shimeji]|uniref:DUF6533 domain-containing protein n=1 Tax=Lyophyllum shimeji TaxID=47721 RepID=A0A9P3UQ30_LYOSH|nr:hypothetical protein LshimejAT787_0506960 [Lyophyllum shimeji]
MSSVPDQWHGYSFLESPQTRKAISVSALSWLVWDSILLCRREYESIWKRENSVVKAVYIFSKYVGLVAQTMNTIWTFDLLSREYLTPRLCRKWFGSQIGVIILLHAALQIILMLRVYALYDCKKPVGLFLLSLGIGEIASISFSSVYIVRGFHFHSTCLNANTPPAVVALIVVMAVVQIIVWGMTLFKQVDIPTRTRLLEVVGRDGAVACSVFVAIFATAVPYTFYVHTLTHSMFAIYMTLVIILTSRIILNMQGLRPLETQPAEIRSGGISLWCLDTTFDTINDGLDNISLEDISASEDTDTPPITPTTDSSEPRTM